MENLTEAQIEEFKNSFQIFDKDMDGVITINELGVAMRAMGHNPTQIELQEIMQLNKTIKLYEQGFYSLSILEAFKVLESQLLKLIVEKGIYIAPGRIISMELIKYAAKLELLSKDDSG